MPYKTELNNFVFILSDLSFVLTSSACPLENPSLLSLCLNCHYIATKSFSCYQILRCVPFRFLIGIVYGWTFLGSFPQLIWKLLTTVCSSLETMVNCGSVTCFCTFPKGGAKGLHVGAYPGLFSHYLIGPIGQFGLEECSFRVKQENTP